MTPTTIILIGGTVVVSVIVAAILTARQRNKTEEKREADLSALIGLYTRKYVLIKDVKLLKKNKKKHSHILAEIQKLTTEILRRENENG